MVYYTVNVVAGKSGDLSGYQRGVSFGRTVGWKQTRRLFPQFRTRDGAALLYKDKKKKLRKQLCPM